MRVTIYPFCGQQDKEKGLFRLESDSSFRMLQFVAGKMVDELGWWPTTVLPPPGMCVDRPTIRGGFRYASMPIDNLHRRLHWTPEEWMDRSDMAILGHELMAFPLRCVRPELKIVAECGLTPTTAWPQTAPLFPLAWQSSDLVYTFSEGTAAEIKAPRVSVWNACFDERNLRPSKTKDIDVLFNQRASATGYSNHKEFVRQMDGTNLRVVMTDPTGYLRKTGEAPSSWLLPPLSTAEYYDLLGRSRVVVGLTTNAYGGAAFREAICSGAVPVALKQPGYIELLGPHWAWYVDDPDTLAEIIDEAGRYGYVSDDVLERARACSYQAVWPKIRRDLETL